MINLLKDVRVFMEKFNVFEGAKSVAKEKEFFEQLIIKEPPNRKIDIDISLYSGFLYLESIEVHDFCISCSKESVFSGKVGEVLKNTFSNYVFPFAGMQIPDPTAYYEKCEFYFSFSLRCAKCGEVHYYSFDIKGNKAFKIGQSPSYSSKLEKDVEKYRNVVDKYYIELKRSISAYTQHMGIAAFVYLRRILEHIVEKEHIKITGLEEHIKFIDKFKVVDDKLNLLPAEISDKKSAIYTVLSKGIHEYDEEECYDLYPIMKYVIITVLDNYLYEKQKKIKLKEISKILDSKTKGE